MKSKELLFLLFFSLLTTFGLQYYLGTKDESTVPENAQSGQRFTAPKKVDVQIHKPLNTEIDFLDAKPARRTKLTRIETNNVRYEFTNDGAALSRIEFKRTWAGREGYFGTIFPTTSVEKEKSAFLVAFDDATPYYYDFVEQKEEADRYLLSYKADFDGGQIYKVFTVFKNDFRMDLSLTFKLKEGFDRKITPRIFFPSPLMPELAEPERGTSSDIITGVVNNEKNKVQIVPKNEKMIESYWLNPTLFGSQDRYFVHSLVNDPQKFIYRGYYKAVELDLLFSVLEGSEIKEDGSWNLTFYLGPKVDDAMAVVDPRLEETLNYGWFAFISKPFSKLLLDALNFLNDYVHNYGLAIILLTLLIKLLLFPFTYRAEESMKKRAEYQKKLDHLQSKYKNNPEALAEARAEFLRKHGMPGLGGCLPMLLQLPVLWGFSIVLSNAIELYKAPFLWIPDLSVKDPYYILPLFVGLSIIFHNPTRDHKQLVQSVVLGIIVAAFVSSFSAGLSLYMMMSTVLAMVQSMVVKKFKLA